MNMKWFFFTDNRSICTSDGAMVAQLSDADSFSCEIEDRDDIDSELCEAGRLMAMAPEMKAELLRWHEWAIGTDMEACPSLKQRLTETLNVIRELS